MNTLGVNWTKLDMARVIAQALFAADKPSSPDNWQVKQLMKHKKAVLENRVLVAIEMIQRQQIAKL